LSYQGTARSAGAPLRLTAESARDYSLIVRQSDAVSRPVNVFRATPARQSLGRDLTPEEIALAQALEEIFATGQHAPAEVAVELQKRGVVPPSGAQTAWSVLLLEEELHRINSSLDAAYRGPAASEQP
jgi:recombinase-like protein